MKLALAAAFALEAASTVHAIAVGTIDPAKKMKRSHFENLVKRQSFTTGNASDSTVLSNALVLQHLEANFYTEGLAKFDQNSFDQAGYYNLRPLLEQVAQDEAEHVNFFTTALKAANISAVQACNYTCTLSRSLQLDAVVKDAEPLTRSCAVPYEDVSGFLRLAQVLENVVVSAFLGAVTSVPTSPRPRSEAGAGAIGELSVTALVHNALADSSMTFPDRQLALPGRPRHHPDCRRPSQRFLQLSPPGVSLPLSDGHPSLGACGSHGTQAVYRKLPVRFSSEDRAIPGSQLYLERILLRWQSLRRSSRSLSRQSQRYRLLRLCAVSEDSAFHVRHPSPLTYRCHSLRGLGANFSVWSNGSCDVPTQIIIDKGQTYSEPTLLHCGADRLRRLTRFIRYSLPHQGTERRGRIRTCWPGNFQSIVPERYGLHPECHIVHLKSSSLRHLTVLPRLSFPNHS